MSNNVYFIFNYVMKKLFIYLFNLLKTNHI